MNRIILMGRLVKDPEVCCPQANPSMQVARYPLAVEKRKKRADGVTADFFQLVAFGRAAEFTGKCLKKGMRILASGHVQTGSYGRDGVRDSGGFMNLTDGADGELPFD